MSSGHAISPRSPRESFTPRRGSHPHNRNNSEQRPRSRSPELRRGGSGYRARRGNHFKGGYPARDRDREPDPESYRGTRGKSYRPNYDRSPIRNVSSENTQPSRSVTSPNTTPHPPPPLQNINSPSATTPPEPLQSVPSPITTTHPPPLLQPLQRAHSPSITTPQPLQIVQTPSRTPKLSQSAAIQALQEMLSSIFEVSIDLACSKLRRDAAEQIVESRKAAFDKSKEFHPKFPSLKETQTIQKLEAEKKFNLLDQDTKSKNETLQGFLTNAAETLFLKAEGGTTERDKTEGDFELRVKELEINQNKFKELVENQANLLKEFQGKFSNIQDRVDAIEKTNIAETKRNADEANRLTQRLDSLEAIGGQVQALVASSNMIQDEVKNFNSRLIAFEEDRHALQNISARLVPLEEKVIAHANSLTSLMASDRLDNIEGQIRPLAERLQTLETTSSSLNIRDSESKQGGEAAALSLDINNRLIHLETKLPELHKNMVEFHAWLSSVSGKLQEIESRTASLDQSQKAVDHGLGNLRSRVDSIYTSDLAKAILDQIQTLYPTLKNVHENISYLNNQTGYNTNEITGLREKADKLLQQDKVFEGFLAQYNMDYNTTRQGIADLRDQSTRTANVIESQPNREEEFARLMKELQELSDKVDREIATATKQINSLEANMKKGDHFIKDKLDVPLKQITRLSMEVKEIKEQREVNNLSTRVERLERRRTPAPASGFSIRGASKKRPINGSTPPTKRRSSVAIENDQGTIYMPANQEESVRGIEDSDLEDVHIG